MRKRWPLRISVAVLIGLHLVVLLAGFISPYNPTAQDRENPYAPPSRIHFIDSRGSFHVRPFVYAWTSDPANFIDYEEDLSNPLPIRFLVHGDSYELAGLISSNLHFFGIDAGNRVALAGTDAFGRDVFSRTLYGGVVSLSAGLVATALTLILAVLIGTTSGYWGGWLDEFLMRFAELFLLLPWLYLLLALRAFLPLSMNPVQMFFLIVVVIGSVGWARPARLVRGVVLSARERNYVLAARGFGASHWHILRHHVLPETYPVLLTQASLLIPQFVLAEVTLSFFGLGLSEPLPSWGSLLASLQQYSVIVSHWWMFVPGGALVIYCLAYFAVADSLQARLKSGH